jgi:hypothetical protein
LFLLFVLYCRTKEQTTRGQHKPVLHTAHHYDPQYLPGFTHTQRSDCNETDHEIPSERHLEC